MRSSSTNSPIVHSALAAARRSEARNAAAALLLSAVVVAVAACGSSDKPDAKSGAVSGPAATFAALHRTASSNSDADQPTPAPTIATPATPTPEPTETPAPTGQPKTGKQRSAAIPLRVGGRVGDWNLSVTNVVTDGTAAVLAENQFNDPPSSGHQYYLVGISATYVGEKEPSQLFELSFKAVGNGNVSYSVGADDCGVVPNEIDRLKDVFNGGTIAGNVCWSVATDDISSLTMYVEPLFGDSSSTVWFALQ